MTLYTVIRRFGKRKTAHSPAAEVGGVGIEDAVLAAPPLQVTTGFAISDRQLHRHDRSGEAIRHPCWGGRAVRSSRHGVSTPSRLRCGVANQDGRRSLFSSTLL